MAVDPDLVDAIAASVADLWREAETALARTVARALRQGMDAPAAEQRLSTVRALRRSAQSIVAALEADTGPTVRTALAQAYRHGWRSALVDLPARFFPQSQIAEAASAALRERSGAGFIEALAVALLGDFGRVTVNILRNVTDVFRDVQAAAAARILTGAQTRREATQAAWQAYVDRGVTGFVDRSGRRWRLSSYAEMAARTVTQRAATQGQVDRLDTLGVELVYVSDAVQECVKCRPWEGRILRTTPGPLDVRVEHATRDIMVTVTAAGTLDEARAAGLFHPNCRHSISAYLPGVTRVPPGRPDPEGDKARQRQRALERRIRRYKERATTALTPEAKTAANARERTAQAALRDHLAEHPELKRLRYREQIGAGNIPPTDRRDDAATPQGPPTEPTLDSGPAPAPRQRTRRRAPEPEPTDEARQPGPDQPVLEPPPEPRRMSDEELEARFMALMSSVDPADQAEAETLAAEIDRRDAERRREAEAPAPPVPDEIPSAKDLRRLPDDVLQALLDAHTADQGADDFLADLLGDVETGESTSGTGRIRAEQVWREDQRRVAPDPADLSDEDLDAALRAAMAPDADPHAAAPLAAEVDRRDALRAVREAEAERAREDKREQARARRERRDAERADRLTVLLEEGWAEEEAVEEVYGISVERQRRDRAIAELRAEGYSGKSFEALARQAYRDYVYRQWRAAGDATRGVLVTQQGLARGIDPISLFSGPEARARRWASDELKGWWDEHGRMTLADFKEQLLGRRGDQAGRDFLA